MALTDQILKKLQLLATQMQYTECCAFVGLIYYTFYIFIDEIN